MCKFTNSKVRLFIAVILICLTIILAFMLCARTVKAEGWSWLANPPVLVYNNPVAGISSDDCQGYYTITSIDGEPNDKQVCIFEGGGLKFGTYLSNRGYYVSAVEFLYDGTMHQLDNFCGQGMKCLYISSSDTLVAKGNSEIFTIVIYKNFKSRLTGYYNVNTLTYNYIFNSSNPEYVFRSKSGRDWGIGSISASNNGEWLLVELTDKGIGLLNMKTYQMKQISGIGIMYGRGMNPTIEMAISNDGQTAAVMGRNAGISFYSGFANCGNDITSVDVIDTYYTNICSSPLISFADVMPVIVGGYHPRFSDDSAELSFFVQSPYGLAKEVRYRAAGYNKLSLDYLAMGDSYSSGEGDNDDSYYLPGTNSGSDKCHNSTRSYPYLIANLSNISPNLMRSVACSGATTRDVVADEDAYLGQDKRLRELANTIGLLNARIDAKINFTQGRIPQEAFVKEYNPRIITVGIGGNDIGLVEKLTSCVGIGTCNWANDLQKKEQTALEIKSLFDTLISTYTTIHAASPSSKIYAVGYPKIIDEGNTCNLKVGALLDDAERKFMNEGIIYINQIIQAAAKRFGIKYLDIQDAYGDSVICGHTEPSAVNDLALGDDISPLGNTKWLKIIGNESFHPNPIGHEIAAQAIYNSIGSLQDYNYCANMSVVCPDENTTAPEPSTYWIPAEVHNYPKQQITNFVTDIDLQQKQLNLDSYSLSPHSIVNIEMNSNPVNLGNFTASDDGSLDITVNLPNDTEEGFHTIHIYGTSFSGEQLDIYQVIKYQKPEKEAEAIDTEPNPVIKNTPTPEVLATQIKEESVAETEDQEDTPSSSEVLGLSTDIQNIITPGINENKVDSVIPKRIENKTSYEIPISISLFLAVLSFALIKLFRLKRAG